MIRHPLFDVFVDVVFYIIADVGPYVTLCVGADFEPYVVLYVIPAHLLDGKASIQIIKASGASEHVRFLPR